MKNIVLIALLVTFSSFASALTCVEEMVGGHRLSGGSFDNANIRFNSEYECEDAIRNSANGLICLRENDFFYHLYNTRWAEQLDSQYMSFEDCVAAIRKARKGLVCADAVRRGTHKLIRVEDHAYRNFNSNQECQSFLDGI